MPVAKAVHTEPLTADDWEILVCLERAYARLSKAQYAFPRNCTPNTWRIISSPKYGSLLWTKRLTFGCLAELASAFELVRRSRFSEIMSVYRTSMCSVLRPARPSRTSYNRHGGGNSSQVPVKRFQEN